MEPDTYIQSLDTDDKETVKQTEGQKIFKFGGGTCLKSKEEYSLPAVIAGNEVLIQIDIVESNIPLVLSRSAMKRAAIKLDLVNDTTVIMGKEVALNLTSSDHYCILLDKSEVVPVENVCAVKLDVLNRNDRFKTLLKLNRHFAHPPMKKLIALLKDAGVWKEEYEETLAEIGENVNFVRYMPKLHQGQ